MQDSSRTAEVRRAARRLAVDSHYDETRAETFSIVTTEICTNMLKHGGGGQIVLRQVLDKDSDFVEILGLDQGPGIEDISVSMRDGQSTTGTMGTGLGAIQRLSSYWALYSKPGKGTAILARVARTPEGRAAGLNTAGLVSAKAGESESGDAWGIRSTSTIQTIVMADGLGHGPEAAKAARTAVEFNAASGPATPLELVQGIHGSLRATRGAAIAVAQLDREQRTVMFAGLGNISALICEPEKPSQHMVSMHGTAGAAGQIRYRQFSYPWVPGAVLILHSDGIGTKWDCRNYPGLLNCDSALIAGVLYRDYCRGSDDASIVVVK